MALITDITEGTRLSFEVYPDAYLANKFKDVVLEGIVTAMVARQLGFDIDAAHQNVYPSLIAAGVVVPNNPREYNYAYVTFLNGESTFVGIPWIREGSVISAAGHTLGLTFYNRNDVRRRRILDALSAVGESPDDSSWT